MNICILNSSDGRYGGFSAMIRLQDTLRDHGHDVVMLVGRKQSDIESVIEGGRFRYLLNKLYLYSARFLRKYIQKHYHNEYYFEYSFGDFYSAEILLSKLPFKPDFFVAGWIDGFITPRVLHDLNKSSGAAIIWYLLDMAPFTGGCHFSWGCRNYTTKCGNCPAIASSKERDISNRRMESKAAFLKNTDLIVVPATEWLFRQASESSVFKNKEIVKILLSVNEEIFYPKPMIEARKILSLSNETKVIFIGATSLEFERKGASYLFDALSLLKEEVLSSGKKVMILTAGGGDAKKIRAKIPSVYEHTHLGYLNDDTSLASAYQVANLFVCPSIEDSGPMMINESIMCGTPVVSFDLGVALDLVFSGKTGYRAKLKSVPDLANGIRSILSLTEAEELKMASNCRKLGLRLSSRNAQLSSFNKLFLDQ